MFDKQRDLIVVRSATRWDGPEEPPKHHEYSASQIAAVAEKLKDLEIELYKLRRAMESVDGVDVEIAEYLKGTSET
jgi:hypothetical protein